MEQSKYNLLSELSSLGVAPTGRKARSDKGKTRGPNTKSRSDKGIPRNRRESSPLSIYCRVRSRVLNNLHDDKYGFANDKCIDQNGIFKIMKRDDYTKEEYHQVISHGVARQRTIRHIAGSTIDLEKYRFEALYNLAATSPNEMPDRFYFAQEINHTGTEHDCWFNLFVRLYHLDERDALLWTYEHWRKDYEILKDTYLAPDFTFNFKHSPGSAQFMSECSELVEQRIKERRLQIIASHEYVVEYARVRDTYLSRVREQYRRQLLNDPTSSTLSKVALNRRVTQMITDVDKECIEADTNADMNTWINKKLRKEGYEL